MAGFLNRTVSIGGMPAHYQVYVPLDYTPAKKCPVILFLHGAGERGSDGLRQTQVGLGSAIRQNAHWFPAMLCCPRPHPTASGAARWPRRPWPRWSNRSASFTATEPGST